ncbi:MAG: hypothetical protein B7Y99_13360 [Caulobacterales bacterium 32-69-10]|nr:MAG: hypothetical protein B7Y99_13360 [Caulobacterales bacterium 32-69-10]
MTPADIFPGLAPFVDAVGASGPANFIKAWFSAWEAAHLASMAILGGTSLLLNLRLIGVGITDEPPSEIHRNLKAWINVGLIGVLFTGVLMAMPDGRRIYNDSAFTVKMLALAAGIIFTYGVSGPVARADGAVGRTAKAWWLVGMAILLLGVFVFSTTLGISPGMWHPISWAGLLVLFVVPGRMRWAYLAGLIVLIVAQTVGTHFVVHQDQYAEAAAANKAFAVVFAAWILGFAGFQLFRSRSGGGASPLTQAIGYASILVWVVVAAAGRWIAFG